MTKNQKYGPKKTEQSWIQKLKAKADGKPPKKIEAAEAEAEVKAAKKKETAAAADETAYEAQTPKQSYEWSDGMRKLRATLAEIEDIHKGKRKF